MVTSDSELESIADKLLLVSLEEDEKDRKMENLDSDVITSDEELARRLQAGF